MGNGHTSEHVNPKNPNITHFHKITDYVIEEAQDGCYPNCFAIYGYQGAGPHTHESEYGRNIKINLRLLNWRI